MKKIFLTPIAALAFAGITMFSCASSNDGYATRDTSDTMGGTETTGTVDDDNVDATGTVGATGTMDDDMGTTGTTGTTGTYGTTDDTETTGTYGTTDDTGATGTTDTDRMNDAGGMNTGTDRMANTDVNYDELFGDVDNTEQYGILELARRDPNFSMFVQLVEQTGMTQALEAAGPLTVFLPTNAAFQEMEKGEYERLTNPQNRTELMKVLSYHVLNTEIGSNQFGSRQVITSGDGTEIPVTATAGPGATPNAPGVVNVGGADIVRADINVSNGVVHIVNGIITPERVTGPGMDR